MKGRVTTKKFWNNQSVVFSLVRAKMCLLFDVYFNLRDLLKALFILYFSIVFESVFLVREKNLSEILGRFYFRGYRFRIVFS
jgi:hypothetical protein